MLRDIRLFMIIFSYLRGAMMKILDYNPNFGTFSNGFEAFDENEVTDVVKLSKNGEYGYNRIHKQWFLHDFNPISTYEPKKKVDLAIMRPEFGENVGKRGKSNFFFYDFEACMTFLSENHPKFAIFQTELDVVPLVNNAEDYIRDGFGNVSKDRIIYKLQELGYKAHLVVLDEAEYGIPLHRSFAFYIATPYDFDFKFPAPLFTRTGMGNFRKFRTVRDAIGDLDEMGDWVSYRTDPQNLYQHYLRNEEQKVTWHHPQNIKSSIKEKVSVIKQGSNNETLLAKNRSKGYNRAKWDQICRSMDDRFYLFSSSQGDSIHPLEDRPFTIREGCRIHGLPDQLSFELSTSKKHLAKMIHNSASPIIGKLFAIALGGGTQKY